jgi:hypothetical protein
MTVDLSIDKKSGCRSRYRMIVGFFCVCLNAYKNSSGKENSVSPAQ